MNTPETGGDRTSSEGWDKAWALRAFVIIMIALVVVGVVSLQILVILIGALPVIALVVIVLTRGHVPPHGGQFPPEL